MRRFVKDDDGAILALSIYFFLMILMTAGIGIDVMHFERDRTKLQSTLDRAVLAAADLDQTLDPESVVEDYFQKAGLLQFLTAVYVTEGQYQRKVSGEVSADIPTEFMRMVGVDTLTANLGSTALERVPNTEISLLLDISGSMGTNDRIGLMKVAAKSFTSKVLSRNSSTTGGAENTNQTSVSVIPFSGQTNPGATMFDYLGGERFGTTTKSGTDGDPLFKPWPQDISNVVFWFDVLALDGVTEINYSVKIDNFPGGTVEGMNVNDVNTYYTYATDYIKETYSKELGSNNPTLLGASIKGGQEPTTFFGVDGYDATAPTKFNKVDLEIQFTDFHEYVLSMPNGSSSCLEMTADDFLNSDLPSGSIEQTPYFVNWDFDEVTQNWGWCPEEDMAIQYAQKDETAMHDFIDNLRLFDGTGTNYGMKYALALLDPNTQPAFAHLTQSGEVPTEFIDRPLAWDADESTKYIVLMSDGRTGTQHRPSEPLDAANADTELTARPSEDSIVESSSYSNLEMFIQQCDLAKSKDVIIYTVALEASSRAVAEIKSCASSPSHFFEVTGPELVDTFVTIASSIQRLRLTL